MSKQNDNGKIIPIHNPNYAYDGKFVNTGKENLYSELLGDTMKKHADEHNAFIINNQRIIEAKERSIADKQARYFKKKKKTKERIAYALTTLAILGMLAGCLFASKHNFENPIVEISEQDKNYIDDRITDYCERAEFIMSNNISTDSVSQYQEREEAITNYLFKAASVSDLEFRCALLGTAKELKGQRFNEMINRILSKTISKKNEYGNLSSLLFSGNVDNLFDELGYKDFTEYWENERNAIYKLFLEKGLTPNEAEVATMFAIGDVTNSNGRGGK